jgi:hypothetical protein
MGYMMVTGSGNSKITGTSPVEHGNLHFPHVDFSGAHQMPHIVGQLH